MELLRSRGRKLAFIVFYLVKRLVKKNVHGQTGEFSWGPKLCLYPMTFETFETGVY